MNPILKLLNLKQPKSYNASPSNKNKTPTSVVQLISGIKSGKIDPKQKAITFLQQMTPQQKEALKQLIPQISKFGTIMGVSQKNMDSFTSEINQYLR